MIATRWALALLLLVAGSYADNTLGADVELNVSSEMADARNVLGFETFIGNGKEDPVVSQYFEHNFGLNETIIGDIDTAKWGIKCVDTGSASDNTCIIDDAADQTDFYFYSMYLYKQAHVVTRLIGSEKVNVDDINKLPIRLVTSPNVWPLKKLGVVGLTPSGDYANYITKLYSGDNSLLFGYAAKDATVASANLQFDNHVVINPVYQDTVKAASFTYDAKAAVWDQKATATIGDSQIKYTDTQVCFANTANDLIVVIDGQSQCDYVRATVCGGKLGNDCTKTIYDPKQAPKITIAFGSTVLEFTGDDYIYFDNNVLQCRFGDLSDVRSQRVCSDGTEFAVGRLFFAKYMPVIHFLGGGKTKLELITSYNFKPGPGPGPGPDGKGLSIWIILGIIALVIVIGLLVFFFLRKRNSDNTEEHYRDL